MLLILLLLRMLLIRMLMFLPNMTACHIGISLDGRGPNNTIVSGEASSLLALAECVSYMERGLADVMIAGGVGNRLNLTPIMYRGDENLSHRSADPAAASRPFDAERDGMVNGEGSAAFVPNLNIGNCAACFTSRHQSMIEFFKDLWAFMRERKKLWLAPIIFVMLFLGALLVFTQGSVVAPFIYTLF